MVSLGRHKRLLILLLSIIILSSFSWMLIIYIEGISEDKENIIKPIIWDFDKVPISFSDENNRKIPNDTINSLEIPKDNSEAKQGSNFGIDDEKAKYSASWVPEKAAFTVDPTDYFNTKFNVVNPWENKDNSEKVENGIDDTNSEISIIENLILESKQENFEIKSSFLSANVNISEENIACVPEMQGYTQEQANWRYRYRNRKFGCGFESQSIWKIKNNTLTLHCEPEPGQFVLGNLPEDELIGNIRYQTKYQPYRGPLDLGSVEYGFVKCGISNKQAFLFNKFSEKVSQNSQEKRRQIMDKLNITDSKPQTVLIILIDSVSRNHFYNTLTDTVDFLNKTIVNGKYSKNYAIYDFLINGAHGENTLPNLIPMMFGYNYTTHKQKTKNLSLKKFEDKEKYIALQNEILWKFYKDLGYVTLFEWETKWDFLADAVGRKILCDHVATSFWRGAAEINGFSDFIDKQRCIGINHSHQYMFDYAKQFLENYKSHNKFGYLHTVAGHEITGSVIKSMDTDLWAFLDWILNFHNENNEDLAILLASDHGLHMGPWDRYEEGKIENLTPFTFLITNKDLLRKIGKNSHENLMHNTKRMMTKFDINLTLKNLGLATYGKIAENSDIYKNWKKRTGVKDAVSLFLEKISDNRNCEDVGIPAYWCKCSKFKAIEIDKISGLAEHIANEGIKTVNRKVWKDKSHEYCSQITLGDILSIEQEIVSHNEIFNRTYKVKISINESSDFIFSIQAYVAPVFLSELTIKEELENELYPLSDFSYGNLILSVQIHKIVRDDQNWDFCIELAELLTAKHSYCVCKSPKTYDLENIPSMKRKFYYEKFKKKLSIIVGIANSTCEETCKKEGKLCENWGLQVVNRLEMLTEPWKERQSYTMYMDNQGRSFKELRINEIEEGEFAGIYFKNQTYKFVQGNWEDLSCNKRNDEVRPICPCSIY
ncbi:unnamed protein product [Blepharisma stoltei]|uniref:Uncharacterized protein n=1 Tax=Blepharisma stoltei TaxID=1481888 RepID=A0AAU9JG06_9CILI|nr:unnamed protein product [Blepharisma stoltei]